MSQVCSNDYAQPPEGIPVWCVDSGFTLEAGVQLIFELIFLALLWIAVAKIKRFFHRRKRRKEVAQKPLTHPAASHINLVFPPKNP